MTMRIASLSLLLLCAAFGGVQTQAPVAAAPTAAAAAAPAAMAATAAATAGAFTRPADRAQHAFCNTPPPHRQPVMPIFHMDVKTGFLNGYRSNQSVQVELSTKYPKVWRIHKFFLTVPENSPYNSRARSTDTYSYKKSVGHWAWNLLGTKTPDIGGSQPIDCGGVTRYGVHGMMSPMGAHAAREINMHTDPYNPFRGYTSVVAKWVPPTNWENIVYRRMVTITAYVTFENTANPRWVKKEISLLNLDKIDIDNYMVFNYGPMYQRIFSTATATRPPPVTVEA